MSNELKCLISQSPLQPKAFSMLGRSTDTSWKEGLCSFTRSETHSAVFPLGKVLPSKYTCEGYNLSFSQLPTPNEKDNHQF